MAPRHGKPGAPACNPAEPEYTARDAAGNLLVHGRLARPLVHELDVTVGPAGHVVGSIAARTIVVEGQVTGDLHATDTIRVTATGRVHGELHAARLGVAAGAEVRGRIVMSRHAVPLTELDAGGVDVLLGG